jgi:hypothetical protein
MSSWRLVEISSDDMLHSIMHLTLLTDMKALVFVFLLGRFTELLDSARIAETVLLRNVFAWMQIIFQYKNMHMVRDDSW